MFACLSAPPFKLINCSIRYIQFFLDLVANSDNVALLYHIALKAKTVRDAESHAFSEVGNVSIYSISYGITHGNL